MRLSLCTLAGVGLIAAVSQPAVPASVLSSAGAAAPSAADLAPDSIEAKLRADLRDVVRNAAPDELISVSIVMREQVARADIQQASLIEDEADRRATIKAMLKDLADRTQPGVIALLEEAQDQGQAADYIVPLWIHNVVGARVTPDVARRLAARDDVAYLNWDRSIGEAIFPVEPAPALDLPGTGGGTDGGNIECGVELMGAPQVWNDLGITGEGVVVGVIDTGACITHPDLANQIWTNPGEIPNNNIDDDGNGFIDDVHGWSFDGNGSDDDIRDTNGHGTHVSGTVAGDGTNGTTTGMAPDSQIMTLKFWNDFSGELSVWNGMEYGTDNGADVLTASLGWPHSMNPDRATWRAVCENSIAMGVVVVYAAGNEGSCCPPVDSVRTPGDVPAIITAGATDCNDFIAGFSSRGPVTWENVPPYNDFPYPPGKIKPTVAAPGVNTESTSNNCSGYRTLSGTSMATPHVSGGIALLLQANPNLTHEEVKQILMDTALDLGADGVDNDSGAGRVQIYDAVLAALESAGAPADLTGVDILTGTALGGDLPEILASDDEYLHIRSGLGRAISRLHLVEFDVAATTDAADPDSLDVTIESRIDEPAGAAAVSLRNWATGEFDRIGGFSVGTTEMVNTIEDVDASNYVSGDGRIETRIENVVLVPFLAFDFESFIDHVEVFVR